MSVFGDTTGILAGPVYPSTNPLPMRPVPFLGQRRAFYLEAVKCRFGTADSYLQAHLMKPEKRLRNVLLSAKLGPITPFFGIANGTCECGKPKSDRHKPGKHPRFPGWQDQQAATDPETISGWLNDFPAANFAVITGVQSVVLDLDIRPGKNGVLELSELEAAAGQTIPPTVTVLSGSGNGAKHLYFKIPPDVANLQRPKGTKGIDFQRSRKAIIVPGSLHESGRFYEFAPGLSPSEVDLAELPLWLLELMRRSSAASSPTAGGLTDKIEKLFDELLKMGPPPGSMKPGRSRSDAAVEYKMKKVAMRFYTDDRSHSDSHWAWTLARNTCHHWDQYLRLWKVSKIRTLAGTKCGRASYEASILNRAFADQKQQWKSKTIKRPIEQTAIPALVKHVRKQAATHREIPRSPVTKAILDLHNRKPELDDTGIARVLNEAGMLGKTVSRNNVKRIRHSYSHLW